MSTLAPITSLWPEPYIQDFPLAFSPQHTGSFRIVAVTHGMGSATMTCGLAGSLNQPWHIDALPLTFTPDISRHIPAHLAPHYRICVTARGASIVATALDPFARPIERLAPMLIAAMLEYVSQLLLVLRADALGAYRHVPHRTRLAQRIARALA